MQILWETLIGSAAELLKNHSKQQLATKIESQGGARECQKRWKEGLNESGAIESTHADEEDCRPNSEGDQCQHVPSQLGPSLLAHPIKLGRVLRAESAARNGRLLAVASTTTTHT